MTVYKTIFIVKPSLTDDEVEGWCVVPQAIAKTMCDADPDRCGGYEITKDPAQAAKYPDSAQLFSVTAVPHYGPWTAYRRVTLPTPWVPRM